MLFRRFVAAAIAAFSLAGGRRCAERSHGNADVPGRIGHPETAEILVVNLANSSSSGPAASCIGSIAFFQCGRYRHRNRHGVYPGNRASRVSPPSVRKRRGIRRPRFDPRRGDRHPNRWIGVSCTPAATLDTFGSSNGVTNHRYAGEEAIAVEN